MITIGQTLGNTYKITEQLGAGGGGIVYKAFHTRLERYVAVKLIKDKVKGIINERAEADILKRLKHDGLPQVYDFVTDGEDVYTVMEYIDGRSLGEEIKLRKKIPYDTALQWSKEICSAAAYLHNRKPAIIHSDIKPANIMLTSEEKICLIDFNISSVFGGGIYTVGSSEGFSPPEQYEAMASMQNAAALASEDNDETIVIDNTSNIIDSRSDVYSIGAVMYMMVTGKKPANSRTAVTPLSKLDAKVPQAFAYIVDTAMSRDKEDRFSSAAEMLEALNKINKLDKRYKRMALRQELAFIFCLLLLAGSVVSIIAGHRMMKNEDSGRYNSYIEELAEMSAENDYSDFDDVFKDVTEEYPDEAMPYYFKAMREYYNKDIQEASETLDKYVIPYISDFSESEKVNIYHIKAERLFYAEDYVEASDYYGRAVNLKSENPSLYCDYALTLARCNDTYKAEEILEEAISLGLEEDSVYMANGEILYQKGEYEQSAESLLKAIELTDDENVKKTSYLICSRAYSALSENDSQIILSNIELLEKSLLDVSAENQLQLREYLVQCYIDYGTVVGNDEYYAKAITLLEKIKYDGNGGYQNDMNLAVLCDRIGNHTGAKDILIDMSETPEYEMNMFKIYAQLAYVEANIQGDIDVNERDYSGFAEFYKQAQEAYKTYSASGLSDPDMDKLDKLYAEMKQLGWLD
ncbi:MAG: protein kinase [Oscillospiraceae bacterium]|nr:protein kinase [Oscillospiraceae bacterium]